jgi:HAD superfamily hydrolase (TIGR01509 family)
MKKTNKAFIFDMDGVIINSEAVWGKSEKQFLIDLIGEDIYEKIKDHLMGSTTTMIYNLVSQYGSKISKKEFFEEYDKQALHVYSLSTPTENINELLKKLSDLGFKIGLVSASRKLWIDNVLKRIKNHELFEYVLSLEDRADLKPKPYPDGYLDAMKVLGATPEKTIVLEDSNKGVASAKASGAFTICLREHLSHEYISEGADMSIENLKTLLTFLDEVNDKYN